MLGVAVGELEDLLVTLGGDLAGLRESHHGSPSGKGNGKGKGKWWWGREEMWIRLRWVGKRKQISMRMGRISALKMEVHIAQMGLLLRYV
jgi:hypothetical protein